MALELNTDGNTQTATTGDTAINNSGIYNATLLGATFLWCAGFFGAYVAFTRVVTGVAIDIVGGAKIDIFTGGKLTIQAAAAYTVQAGEVFTLGKIKELNVQADVMKKITNLQTLLSSQTQIIDESTDWITTLTQKVDKKISNYLVEEKNGDTSYEAWAKSKIITSANYFLKCDELASMSVGDENAVEVAPDGVTIYGKLIELE